MGITVVLVVGTLIVNYLKSNKGSIPEELLTNNSIETSAKIHKVVKGDNLWNIAVVYYGDGFKWVDIATENKLVNASIIEIDQELTIPNMKSEALAETTDSIAKVDNLIATEAIDGNSYTVVKGDSLWKIAVRAYGDGYQWVKIARENKLTTPNLIFSGNVLALPR